MRKAFGALALMGLASAVQVNESDSLVSDSLQNLLVQTQAQVQADDEVIKSTEWSTPVSLTFSNVTDEPVQLYWHDYQGNLVPYKTIGPN